jgi:GPH family glycoside/pentoside/hexuronide:cation symporter
MGATAHHEGDLSRWRLLAYGQMGLPLAALSLPLYIYLPSFYAETLGLGLAAVGGILLAARLWDLVLDPLIGALSDRIGRRGSRRKRWIGCGAPLLVVGTLLLFIPSQGIGGTYLLVTSFVFYLGATMVMLPYIAWGAELGGDYHGRSRVAGHREAFVILGTLVAVAVPAMFADDLTASMRVLGIGTAALFCISLVLTAAYVPDPPQNDDTAIDWWRSARTIAENKAFRHLLSAYLLNGCANGLPATLFILFVGHRLGMADAAGPLLMLYFLCGFLGMPAWFALSRRIDKRLAWSAAMLLASASFIAVPFLGTGDIVVFAVICVISGLCLGADLMLPPSMQADIIEADARATGEHRAGAYFGFWNVATKLALALAVGIAFPVLEWAGFEAGGDTQSEQGLVTLGLLYGGLPVALKLAAVVLVMRRRLPGEQAGTIIHQDPIRGAPHEKDSVSPANFNLVHNGM